jgi:phenylalanyl-tRNA synthetase beta chain
MKISLNWLREYIDIGHLPAPEIGSLLTQSGLEVEGVETYEQVKGSLEGLVIGEVVSCEKHPNADKLTKTTVDIGQGQPVPIVCGAPNVALGQKVVVAPVGSTIYPINGEPFKLSKAKIRGEVSEGMIVAEDEVGLGTSHDGIMVLDTHLPAGTPAKEHFNIHSDQILEIGLTPNRSDATSHIGVARDLRALTGKEIAWPSVAEFKTDKPLNKIQVIVENTEACPRYSGLTIEGITVKDSPQWLQNRLKSIGMTPINNVVDATNFVLHELGQPLHAFDAAQVSGQKVVVKTMPEGSRFVTLDEKERKLGTQDLMICNAEEGMCIAGVFGGLKSGVTDFTTGIFLESAYFNPNYIRRTSQLHGLKTDASFRFERGTDPNMTVFALKRAALLIKELAGGDITSEVIDIYPNPIKDFKVGMKFRNIDRLIGKKLDRETIYKILNSLDIKVENTDEIGFTAIVPPYRYDVEREADVIEEILRIYGYDNIELSRNLKSDYLSDFPEVDPDSVQYQISNLLAANGYNEILTNSLTKPTYTEKIGGFNAEDNVEILNKLSEDLGVLRQSLMFTGLESIAYNINHKQREIRFFEFGKTYRKNANGYIEKYRLSIFLSGNVEAENWRNQTKSVQFHDLYSTVTKIFNKFIVGNPQNEPCETPFLEYGLEFKSGGQVLGYAGKVDSDVLKIVDIKQDVFYADLDWEVLLGLTNRGFEYVEVSKYPEVRRDLSLVIDKSLTFEEIKKIALKEENSLIRNINIFDYYEGENIGKDKKAYALSFILQDRTKTLTDKIIDRTMERLMKTFETELGAIIRK